MKKIAIFTLLSAAAIAQADMRVVDVPVEATYPESAVFVEKEVTPSGTVIIEEEYPAGYPRYYRDGYRPVAGVVSGAETATEGVVEGTAEAVRSVLP